MTSHRDMKTLGDDADTVRRLASHLLALPDPDWTDWERLFLDGLADRRSDAPLSMRQREILVDLRDSVTRLSSVEGFAIANLIRGCWLNRLELEADDQDFIERLAAEKPRAMRKRAAYRLLRLANTLDVVPRFAEAV